MSDGLDQWRGETTAKLDMLRESLREIKQQLTVAVGELATLKATAAKIEDVAALKATARAWGTFAGFISGLAVSIAGRWWR